MSRSGRGRRDRRFGALALLIVSLLTAAAQQPLTAASKHRKFPAVANQVNVAPPAPAPVPAAAAAVVSDAAGYWLVGSDGGVYAYGAAPFKGSTGALKLNKP